MRKIYTFLSVALLASAAYCVEAQAQTEKTATIDFSNGDIYGQNLDYEDLTEAKFEVAPLTLTLTNTTNSIMYRSYQDLFIKKGTSTFNITADSNKITKVVFSFDDISKAFSMTSPEGTITNEGNVYTLSIPDGGADGIDFTITSEGNRALYTIEVQYIDENGGSGDDPVVNPTRDFTLNLAGVKLEGWPEPTTASPWQPLSEGTKFQSSFLTLTYDSTTGADVQYRGEDKGIFMKKGDTTFTLSSKDNKLTKVVLKFGGEIHDGVISNYGKFTGTSYMDSFTWTAPADYDGGDIVFTVCNSDENYGSSRYFESITVTYEVDANAAHEPEISFVSDDITISIANTTYPLNFLNPNNLEASFTSSDESVAVVNGEVIEIKGAGTTTITATTEEQNDFEAGKATMKLTVINGALNIKELSTLAPQEGDEVKVEFESVVAYYKNHYLYVLDIANGNLLGGATLIMTENTTSYRKDNVIPTGWYATNSTTKGNSETWTGKPSGSTYNLLDLVQYSPKGYFTEADVNHIITLTGVSIYNDLKGNEQSFIGTLANGSSCLFSTEIVETPGAVEMGVYNVVGAVAKANGSLFFRPISYTKTGELTEIPGIKLSASFPSTGEYTGVLQFVPETSDESAGIVAFITTSQDSAPVTIEIPEGYDSMYYALQSLVNPLKAGVQPTEDWVTEEEATTKGDGYGFIKGNTINVPASGSTYTYAVYFGNEGMVNVVDQYRLTAKVDKDLNVSVEGVEAIEEGVAEYYTIQGVKVANPEKGLFIKVLNGKATKVIIK